MINLNLNDDIIEYSHELVKKCNFGNRGYSDGTKEEQLTGVVAENAVRKYLGLELMKLKNGYDGGFDVIYKGYKTDIKSMNRKDFIKPYYVHNVLDCQIKKNVNCEAFIFTNLIRKKRILQICGFIKKNDFIKLATLYLKGTQRFKGKGSFFIDSDNWELKQEDLIKNEQRYN